MLIAAAGIKYEMFAVSYMLIMHCAIPRMMLQVLLYVMPYVLTVARVVLVTSVSAMHGLTNSARAVFCMVNGRMLCSAMQFCPTRNG